MLHDHSVATWLELGLIVTFIAACAPLSLEGEVDGEGGWGASLPLAPTTHELGLFSSSGEALVMDPKAGDIRARAALASGLRPRDASIAMADDGTPAGLLVFGADEDETQNVLETFGLSESSARELGTFGGAVHVFGLAQGALVTQEDQGERWKLLPHSRAFQASVACGRPQSLRVVATSPDQTRIEALSTWPDGALSSLSVVVEPSGVRECVATPLETGRPVSADARLLELGGPVSRALVDLRSGELSVGPLDGLSVTAWESVPVPSRALEHAIVVGLGERRRALVALVSGPPRLVAVEIAAAPDMTVELGLPVSVDLEFPPSRARRFVSRDLVAIESSLFVATSGGVFAYSLSANDGPLVLEQSAIPEFGEGDLRGPLVAVPTACLP